MAAAMNGAGLMEAISARLRRGDVTLERADCGADVIKLERADSSDGALSLSTGGPSELRWHNAPIATYVSEQRLFRCGQCAVTAFVARPMAEHWLGAHADFKAFQCPHCPYMSSWQRCVRMHLVRHHGDRVSEVAEFSNSNVMADILERLSELKREAERHAPSSPPDDEPIVEEVVTDDGAGGKRHHCPYCPYSTHRRDLYNRHENIHKSDKPFQCYICQRMFNRADHVKKHFLRIHRDDPYDVTRIRRIPPKTLTAQVYYSRAPSLVSQGQPLRSPEKPVVATPPALPPPPPPAPLPPVPTPPAREDAKPLVLSPNPRVGVRRWAVSPPSSPAPTKRPASPFPDQKENRRQRRADSTPSESDASSGAEATEVPERAGRQGSFACAECPWRGFDSWCLKRHMNTHTKPYTCPLCPYKAARSERLTWHAAKVHAKKICIKCFFVCDDQVTLSVHQLNTHQNGQSRQGFTCVMCAYTFKLHTELEAHMVAEHGRAMLDCSVCLFRTTDPAVLTDHVRYSHQQRPGRQLSPTLSLSAGGGGAGAAPVILNVPSVRSEHTPSPPPGEAGEPAPMEQLPPPPPPPPSPCEECRQVRPPLVCTHSGGTLRCQAARCRFEAGDAGSLQAHVAARHADGALRCPHCAAPLGSVLEFCLHWPLHHVSLCWSCAELTEQHFTVLQHPAPPPPSSAAAADQTAIDCGSFLRLEMRTEEEGEEDEEALFTGEEEEDATGGDRGAVKRSRKQSRPQRRPLSPDGENGGQEVKQDKE